MWEEVFLRAQVLVASLNSMPLPQHDPWTHMCKGIILNNSHFNTIFPSTHIFQHHLSSHYITPWIKWLLPAFPKRLRTRPRPQTFIWFHQVDIPTHVAFINKWSFGDGFLTPLGLFSPRGFSEWIPLIVLIMFSYHTWSHSTLNCMCLWSGPPFSHDQACYQYFFIDF